MKFYWSFYSFVSHGLYRFISGFVSLLISLGKSVTNIHESSFVTGYPCFVEETP